MGLSVNTCPTKDVNFLDANGAVQAACRASGGVTLCPASRPSADFDRRRHNFLRVQWRGDKRIGERRVAFSPIETKRQKSCPSREASLKNHDWTCMVQTKVCRPDDRGSRDLSPNFRPAIGRGAVQAWSSLMLSRKCCVLGHCDQFQTAGQGWYAHRNDGTAALCSMSAIIPVTRVRIIRLPRAE
jgi:hypothetical protein